MAEASEKEADGQRRKQVSSVDDDHMANNDCRMYEKQFPDVEDLVVVVVNRVADMGAYVSLLEYNNIEGMILLSELSRRRIRSIHKLIRVGKQEIVVVVRVDQDKGYIDLSKRRASPEDIAKHEEKYNKSKAVHSILRHVSETCKVRLEQLYKDFGWDLYKRFGHAYEGLSLLVHNPDPVLAPYDIREDVKLALLKDVKRRLTAQPFQIRCDFEVTCFAYEGIDAIKAALRAGEAVGNIPPPQPQQPEKPAQEGDEAPPLPPDAMRVKIKLVAPPLFVMTTTALDKQAGMDRLSQACNAIQDVIKSKTGQLVVKSAPRVVSERDDKLLAGLMEALEKQNMEVSGDDPEAEQAVAGEAETGDREEREEEGGEEGDE